MNRKLAIKGHSTRGKEVIELLEMMGGKNCYNLNGLFSENAYYLIGGPHNDEILGGEYMFGNENIYWFTLEEFLKKHPFKVGNKVMDGRGNSLTIKSMSWSADCKTMVYDFEETEDVLATKDLLKWNDGFYDAETKENDMRKTGYTLNELIDLVPLTSDSAMIAVREGFEIIEDQGKFFLKSIKPKYPKTYGECCRVLDISDGEFMFTGLSDDEYNLFDSLVALKRCRDAYWKIAGEEMGLGKPWEPDYNSSNHTNYFTICVFNNEIEKSCTSNRNVILTFPTLEMRDTFYENFKDLIENCKELL